MCIGRGGVVTAQRYRSTTAGWGRTFFRRSSARTAPFCVAITTATFRRSPSAPASASRCARTRRRSRRRGRRCRRRARLEANEGTSVSSTPPLVAALRPRTGEALPRARDHAGPKRSTLQPFGTASARGWRGTPEIYARSPAMTEHSPARGSPAFRRRRPTERRRAVAVLAHPTGATPSLLTVSWRCYAAMAAAAPSEQLRAALADSRRERRGAPAAATHRNHRHARAARSVAVARRGGGGRRRAQRGPLRRRVRTVGRPPARASPVDRADRRRAAARDDERRRAVTCRCSPQTRPCWPPRRTRRRSSYSRQGGQGARRIGGLGAVYRRSGAGGLGGARRVVPPSDLAGVCYAPSGDRVRRRRLQYRQFDSRACEEGRAQRCICATGGYAALRGARTVCLWNLVARAVRARLFFVCLGTAGHQGGVFVTCGHKKQRQTAIGLP